MESVRFGTAEDYSRDLNLVLFDEDIIRNVLSLHSNKQKPHSKIL